MQHTQSLFRLRYAVYLAVLTTFLVAGAVRAANAEQHPGKPFPRIATPTFIDPGPVPVVTVTGLRETSATISAYDQERLLNGHLLRRLGFGENKKDLKQVKKKGRVGFIDYQLNPSSIDDSKLDNMLLPPPDDFFDDYNHLRNWYLRMIFSKKQLQEKMTLIWHEHFATSNEKVGSGGLMHMQEQFLRSNALGSFRNLLIGIAKDQAMLIWLDNDYNDGNAFDDDGNRIPPNENFAREFMQLFSLGTARLNIDGTPMTDGQGIPLPAYTENDVREVARALTGWHVDYESYTKGVFEEWLHDDGDKTILGVTVHGRTGTDGANEVQDVVDILMSQPTMAPFISKTLIQKLATETPTPGYVQRVSTVFVNTNGDLKQVVRAILTDSEFQSPDVVRTQYKEPIEQIVQAVRALDGKSKGEAMVDWTYDMSQLLYYPPTVFSFYPPGQKGSLVNTALTIARDRVADEFATGWWDTYFTPAKLIKKYNLTSPQIAADYLEDRLLTAPMQTQAKNEVISYFGGSVTEEKLRGAIWLVLCSPDYQRN